MSDVMTRARLVVVVLALTFAGLPAPPVAQSVLGEAQPRAGGSPVLELAIKNLRVPCRMPGDSSKGSATQFFSGMHFVDSRTGWARAGHVYWCWTTDGGVTWTPMQSEDGKNRFGRGYFVTRQHGWIRWVNP